MSTNNAKLSATSAQLVAGDLNWVPGDVRPHCQDNYGTIQHCQNASLCEETLEAGFQTEHKTGE